MSSVLTWLADHLIRRHEKRLDVRLRVHAGYFQRDAAQVPHWFLNVWNASPERPATVTHVWIESEPRVYVQSKKLPVTIPPEQEWETYLPVVQVPAGVDAQTMARARLTGDVVVESEPRLAVPEAGYVP